MKNLIHILILSIAILSCKKSIKLDLPEVDQDYVVEGRIETNLPPIVILTKTQGYFDEANADAIFASFIHGATITVSSGGIDYPLTEICTNSVPDSLLGLVSVITGIPEESLAFFDYCIYTSFDPGVIGTEGNFYDLHIVTDGTTLTSTTKIPFAVPLTNLWFKATEELDTLGFVWANLVDPDTLGNYYRWYAQRINHHTFGPEIGTMKDPFPIAPLGSSFDDKFFNGLSFDFAYNRGEIGKLEGQDDEGTEEGYFKTGDTVVVKFCSTTRDNFLYLRAMENQAATAGSPFATAGNLPFNINGGIGIWAGYAPSYDTLVCQ